MKAQPKPADALRVAAQVDRDGVAFFRRAKALAADPRVKFIFGRAADEYERALKSLESVPGAKAKAKVRAVFPFEKYERIECYVCGYESKDREPPETCPACGAARYAFERDVKQEEAWDLIARTTKEALALERKAGTAGKAAAKGAVTLAIEIHKQLLDEAKQERARVGAMR
jgi:hypothetical protein